MIVFTYRYLWQVKGSDQINFKIVSDVPDGLKSFEDALLAIPGLVKCAKEYLHEYDCSLVGLFETLFDGGDISEKE